MINDSNQSSSFFIAISNSNTIMSIIQIFSRVGGALSRLTRTAPKMIPRSRGFDHIKYGIGSSFKRAAGKTGLSKILKNPWGRAIFDVALFWGLESALSSDRGDAKSAPVSFQCNVPHMISAILAIRARESREAFMRSLVILRQGLGDRFSIDLVDQMLIAAIISDRPSVNIRTDEQTLTAGILTTIKDFFADDYSDIEPLIGKVSNFASMIGLSDASSDVSKMLQLITDKMLNDPAWASFTDTRDFSGFKGSSGISGSSVLNNYKGAVLDDSETEVDEAMLATVEFGALLIQTTGTEYPIVRCTVQQLLVQAAV